MIRWYPWQPSQQHLNETDFILFIFCERMKVEMPDSDRSFQWMVPWALCLNGDFFPAGGERDSGSADSKAQSCSLGGCVEVISSLR